MKYYIVIDTNIIVSALLSKHNDAATVQVLKALFDNKFTPIFNDEILNEYYEVLHREKFHFPEHAINATLVFLKKYGIYVDRIPSNEILPDPKDLVFYEVCLSKREDASMLVTGNIKHFPTKTFIITPNELLNILNQ